MGKRETAGDRDCAAFARVHLPVGTINARKVNKPTNGASNVEGAAQGYRAHADAEVCHAGMTQEALER